MAGTETTEGRPIPMAPFDTRPTVSIMQACERAGVSRRTIYSWMAAGKLEYRRNAGGAVRIIEASLWKSTPPGGDL